MTISLKQMETYQIHIYVATILFAIIFGLFLPSIGRSLEVLVTPVLALMLYGMFSQIPFLEIRQAFRNRCFLAALITANFIVVPLFVWVLIRLFLTDSILQLGVMMVLLTPCIDYVIVFTHLGKGNAKLMLAATPILFILQMLLLPFYLGLFLNADAANLIHKKPFLEAFFFLIVIPLSLALIAQLLVGYKRHQYETFLIISAWLPVPFMAATLFVVIASQIDTISHHVKAIQQVIPLYITYLIASLVIGWVIKLWFQLKTDAARTLTFSIGTRNSLVVLPFALALPEPTGKLAALVIVTQTLVELMGEIFYIRVIPWLIR